MISTDFPRQAIGQVSENLAVFRQIIITTFRKDQITDITTATIIFLSESQQNINKTSTKVHQRDANSRYYLVIQSPINRTINRDSRHVPDYHHGHNYSFLTNFLGFFLSTGLPSAGAAVLPFAFGAELSPALAGVPAGLGTVFFFGAAAAAGAAALTCGRGASTWRGREGGRRGGGDAPPPLVSARAVFRRRRAMGEPARARGRGPVGPCAAGAGFGRRARARADAARERGRDRGRDRAPAERVPRDRAARRGARTWCVCARSDAQRRRRRAGARPWGRERGRGRDGAYGG